MIFSLLVINILLGNLSAHNIQTDEDSISSEIELADISQTNDKSRGDRKARFAQSHLSNMFKLSDYLPFVRNGECGKAEDGLPKQYCPSADEKGKWYCVDDYMLCDNVRDCPNAEDESRTQCMFYKSVKSQLELVEKTLSRITRNRIPRFKPTLYRPQPFN